MSASPRMVVIAVTDIHGRAETLDLIAAELAAADLVLLTGDLTHFGRRPDAERVVEAVRRHNPNILAVSGNCDYPEVEGYLIGQGIGLHARHQMVGGVAFLGLGGSLPAPGRTPNEFTERELAAFLEEAATGLDPAAPCVLVSHQPPTDTAVDKVNSGAHVGSRAVRRFIEEHAPLVCFSGHIHEAAGTDAIGPTRLVNPGPLRNGGYAHARLADGAVELEIRRFR